MSSLSSQSSSSLFSSSSSEVSLSSVSSSSNSVSSSSVSVSSLSSQSSSSNSSSSFDVGQFTFSSIVGGNTFQKVAGSKTSLASVADLMNIPSLNAHTAFNDSNYWEAIVILFQHANGDKKVVTHKLRDGQWIGTFKVSSFTNLGAWKKKRIVIRNKDGNLFSVYRTDIGSNEDITITA